MRKRGETSKEPNTHSDVFSGKYHNQDSDKGTQHGSVRTRRVQTWEIPQKVEHCASWASNGEAIRLGQGTRCCFASVIGGCRRVHGQSDQEPKRYNSDRGRLCSRQGPSLAGDSTKDSLLMFVQQVGADLCMGSLIKNPGGTIVTGGGYVAGKAHLVEAAQARLTAPGVGIDAGCVPGDTVRLMMQGDASS